MQAIVPVVCLAVLLGCHQGAQPQSAHGKQESKAPIKAYIYTSQPVTWARVARCQGNLVPDAISVIGAKVAGLVDKIHVDMGDHVDTDTKLATLDKAEFELQVASAEAALLQTRSAVGLKPGDSVSKLDPQNAPPVREARAVLEEARTKRQRWSQLREQNAVSEEDYEQLIAAEKVADARLASAVDGVNEKIAQIALRTAELALAKKRLEESTIVASFPGLVQQSHVEAGTFVQVGSPVATVVRSDVLRFRGAVPERIAPSIKLGLRVNLTIQYSTERVSASITRISPALEMQSRSLAFEATIDNKSAVLKPGLFAEAEIILDDQAKAVVIPESALVEFAGAEKVWKVVNGQAKEQPVRASRRESGQVEIVEGLAFGDQILQEGDQGRLGAVEAMTVNNDIILRNAAVPNKKADSKIDSPKKKEPESKADLPAG